MTDPLGLAKSICDLALDVLRRCSGAADVSRNELSSELQQLRQNLGLCQSQFNEASPNESTLLAFIVNSCADSARKVLELWLSKSAETKRLRNAFLSRRGSQKHKTSLMAERLLLERHHAQLQNVIRECKRTDSGLSSSTTRSATTRSSEQQSRWMENHEAAQSYAYTQPGISSASRMEDVLRHSDWTPEGSNFYGANVSHVDEDRSQDRDPWESRRILCLDGSNFKGMVSLLVLDRLMELVAIKEQETKPRADSSSSSPLFQARWSSEYEQSVRFRPCHYFDYICGSGTGGMSAIMLGSMRFSVKEVVERNKAILRALPISLSRLSVSGTRTMLSGRNLLGTLQENLEIRPQSEESETRTSSNVGIPDYAILKADDDMCQTICITAIQSGKGIFEPYVLRSYQRPYDVQLAASVPAAMDSHSRETCKMPIVDACLGTMAPRGYQRSSSIQRWFPGVPKDVSRLDMDSAWEAYQEVSARTPNIECLLSISCVGSKGSTQTPGSHKSRQDYLLHKRLGSKLKRFEIMTFAQDDLTQLEGVEEKAEQFCKKHEIELHTCAEELVQARRRRAETLEWSKFAGLKIVHKSQTWVDPIAVDPTKLQQAHAKNPRLAAVQF